MRAHLTIPNRAFALTVSPDGARLSFDPATGLVEIPAGPSKLAVRQDGKSGWYLALTNPINDPRFPIARNVLALSASRDLTHWRRLADLVTDDSGLAEKESAALTGFQYPDFLIEGADLVYLVRMAYRGAHNYHDSNRIGFFRLPNFRDILKNPDPVRRLRTTQEPM